MLLPLATTADLQDSKVDVSDGVAIAALLARASDAVRDAAGSSITRQTSAVTITTEASRRIELPARPVHAVLSVELDGIPVTDWALRGSALWRTTLWHHPSGIPSLLTVEFDHGWDEVPADVVSLVCSLVAAGLRAVEDGYDPKRGMSYERIDDYQYGMQSGDQEIIDPFELPERTKTALRRRFGPTRSIVSGSVR